MQCSSELSVTAALLHDVVDDTRVDIAEVEAAFGAKAATLVATVTRLSQMNQLMRRKARKAREQVLLHPFPLSSIVTSDVRHSQLSYSGNSLVNTHAH